MIGSIFNSDERYTDIAIKLDNEASNIVRRLFKKYIEEGIKIREISHVLIHNILGEELENILTKGDIK